MASGDGLVEVLVEYEYTAEQDDELSLKPGDIVTEVVKLDGGWWEGSLGGKRGVFPDNFVKEITKKRPVEKKKAPKSTPPPSSGKDVTKDAKRSRRAKATYSYVAENPDELSLKPGDIVEVVNQEEEGWWEGIVDGKRGVFPSNFVQFTDDATKGEENDFKEIKGKKIKGVGFGDIFAGGVPKLKPKKQGSTDSEISSPPIVNNQSNHRVIPEVQHSNVSISPKIKESPPSKPDKSEVRKDSEDTKGQFSNIKQEQTFVVNSNNFSNILKCTNSLENVNLLDDPMLEKSEKEAHPAKTFIPEIYFDDDVNISHPSAQRVSNTPIIKIPSTCLDPDFNLSQTVSRNEEITVKNILHSSVSDSCTMKDKEMISVDEEVNLDSTTQVSPEIDSEDTSFALQLSLSACKNKNEVVTDLLEKISQSSSEGCSDMSDGEICYKTVLNFNKIYHNDNKLENSLCQNSTNIVSFKDVLHEPVTQMNKEEAACGNCKNASSKKSKKYSFSGIFFKAFNKSHSASSQKEAEHSDVDMGVKYAPENKHLSHDNKPNVKGRLYRIRNIFRKGSSKPKLNKCRKDSPHVNKLTLIKSTNYNPVTHDQELSPLKTHLFSYEATGAKDVATKYCLEEKLNANSSGLLDDNAKTYLIKNEFPSTTSQNVDIESVCDSLNTIEDDHKSPKPMTSKEMFSMLQGDKSENSLYFKNDQFNIPRKFNAVDRSRRKTMPCKLDNIYTAQSALQKSKATVSAINLQVPKESYFEHLKRKGLMPANIASLMNKYELPTLSNLTKNLEEVVEEDNLELDDDKKKFKNEEILTANTFPNSNKEPCSVFSNDSDEIKKESFKKESVLSSNISYNPVKKVGHSEIASLTKEFNEIEKNELPRIGLSVTKGERSKKKSLSFSAIMKPNIFKKNSQSKFERWFGLKRKNVLDRKLLFPSNSKLRQTVDIESNDLKEIPEKNIKEQVVLCNALNDSTVENCQSNVNDISTLVSPHSASTPVKSAKKNCASKLSRLSKNKSLNIIPEVLIQDIGVKPEVIQSTKTTYINFQDCNMDVSDYREVCVGNKNKTRLGNVKLSMNNTGHKKIDKLYCQELTKTKSPCSHCENDFKKPENIILNKDKNEVENILFNISAMIEDVSGTKCNDVQNMISLNAQSEHGKTTEKHDEAYEMTASGSDRKECNKETLTEDDCSLNNINDIECENRHLIALTRDERDSFEQITNVSNEVKDLNVPLSSLTENTSSSFNSDASSIDFNERRMSVNRHVSEVIRLMNSTFPFYNINEMSSLQENEKSDVDCDVPHELLIWPSSYYVDDLSCNSFTTSNTEFNLSHKKEKCPEISAPKDSNNKDKSDCSDNNRKDSLVESDFSEIERIFEKSPWHSNKKEDISDVNDNASEVPSSNAATVDSCSQHENVEERDNTSNYFDQWSPEPLSDFYSEEDIGNNEPWSCTSSFGENLHKNLLDTSVNSASYYTIADSSLSQ